MVALASDNPKPTPPHWLVGLRNLLGAILRARLSPDDFLQFAFTDSDNRRLAQAAIHLELQAFLSGHRKALVELPRDHGKTLQMCARVVWELGHNPGLRVKIVCANDDIAGQRRRYLRDAIARNPGVRAVFPELLPEVLWRAGTHLLKALRPVARRRFLPCRSGRRWSLWLAHSH